MWYGCRYEREGRGRRTVKAQQLFYEIVTAQTETGTPYMLYKDACNRKSNQQNLGTITCSNLCTEIVEYCEPGEVSLNLNWNWIGLRVGNCNFVVTSDRRCITCVYAFLMALIPRSNLRDLGCLVKNTEFFWMFSRFCTLENSDIEMQEIHCLMLAWNEKTCLISNLYYLFVFQHFIVLLNLLGTLLFFRWQCAIWHQLLSADMSLLIENLTLRN